MCIIAVSEPGVQLLSKQMIENCWSNNRDGAGFAIQRGGVANGNPIEVRKGFMKLEDLMTALSEANITVQDMVVYHFRIATSGGVFPSKCHPFPITTDRDLLERTSFTHDKVLIHNGVFGAGKDGLSDTQLYAMELAQRATLDSEVIAKEVSGNKVVTMETGATWYYGTWDVLPNRLRFSNRSYAFKAPAKSKSITISLGRRGSLYDKLDQKWFGRRKQDVDSRGEEIYPRCPECGSREFDVYDMHGEGWGACNACGEDFIKCTACDSWTRYSINVRTPYCEKCQKDFMKQFRNM